MKSLIGIVIFSVCPLALMAGPIIESAKANATQTVEAAVALDYPQLLQFFRDSYAESKADPQGYIAQAASAAVLAKVSIPSQIGIAIDFLVGHTDWEQNIRGIAVLDNAFLKGWPVTDAQRTSAINAITARLSLVPAGDRLALNVAQAGVRVLVLMGRDEGLDAFLTNGEKIRNYRRKDGWNETSDASKFETLRDQYSARAAQVENQNPAVEKVMSMVYELCRLRRTQGKPISPIAPLIRFE